MHRTYGLAHIRISVRNLEKSVRFYKGLLGMKELRRVKGEVFLRTPGSRDILTIKQAPRSQWPIKIAETGVHHFGFGFRKPFSLLAMANRVLRLGGKPIQYGGERKTGRVMFMVFDPDGYKVEIYWETSDFWPNHPEDSDNV